MRPIIAFLALLPAAPAHAQDAAAEQRAREIEAVCAKTYCREPRTVRLRREDGSSFETAVPRLPIVLPNGWITIYPGEEVHVELAVSGVGVKATRAVPKPRRGVPTLTLRLAQQDGKADTTLAATHDLSQNLKYTLGLMLPSGGQVLGTSSCPVRPGLVTTEHWPNPVFQVVVRDLRLLADDAPLNCGP